MMIIALWIPYRSQVRCLCRIHIIDIDSKCERSGEVSAAEIAEIQEVNCAEVDARGETVMYNGATSCLRNARRLERSQRRGRRAARFRCSAVAVTN